MELVHIKGNTYYIPGYVNIGVVINDNKALIIDTGNDRSAGKKILKVLEDNQLDLQTIINTHSHADHIGGNAHIQKQTNCAIYASKVESQIIEQPYLEPFFLYGAHPFKGMRNKFLEAKPSLITGILNLGSTTIEPFESIEVIDIKGHFLEQIGIVTRDGVAFLGDAIFSEEIIDKYGFFYLQNVRAFLETLDRLKRLEADYFVPSHCHMVDDLETLIDLNRQKVIYNSDLIEKIVEEPKGLDAIFKAVGESYNLSINHTQVAIVGGTIKAYLTYLIEEKRVVCDFTDGYLRFVAKK